MDDIFKNNEIIGGQNTNINMDENLFKDQLFAMFKSLMAQKANNINNQNQNLQCFYYYYFL